ncbi:hypothetical protein [Sphingomonas sp.]|uniref:hypothetical protein n=1 Tax=Sphingomonas sp. TaxID=28214 RepID=UPI002E321E64|nr:hypothetical protein [Sphingomonas sp.]HEX4693154.1 hypothetical protein [Sphingomonas sp.]
MRQVAGDDYEFIIAGDIDRGGQFIEAWKNGNPDGENTAYLFTAYESDKMSFWCADEVPLQLVEEMIAIAMERHHAENNYNFLLRKG